VKAAAAEVKAGSPSEDPESVHWAPPSLSGPIFTIRRHRLRSIADWRVRRLHAPRISTRHHVRVLALRKVRRILTVFRPPYISQGFVIRPGFSVKVDPFHWRKTTPFSQTGK